MLADFSVLQTNSYSSSGDKTLHKLKVWMTIVESRWGVASGCGEQEAGVASGSGWNRWVWLLGVVVRRYIDFLILLILIPLVSVLFCSSILLFVHLKKCFSFFNYYAWAECVWVAK